MDQRNLRRTAAQNFMQSLDELQEVFKQEPQPDESNGSSRHQETSPPIDARSLEQAADDIEQFFQT